MSVRECVCVCVCVCITYEKNNLKVAILQTRIHLPERIIIAPRGHKRYHCPAYSFVMNRNKFKTIISHAVNNIIYYMICVKRKKNIYKERLPH